MLDIDTAALDAMQASGLLPDSIIRDGSLQRCPTDDRPNLKNGWYRAFSDPPYTVLYGNWRTGEEHTWTAKGAKDFTPAEREAYARQKAEAEAQRKEAQAEAAKEAQSLYAAATECTEHPYLTAKGVKAVPLLKVGADLYGNQNALVVPFYDESKTITTIESIPAAPGQNGKWLKFWHREGRKKGSFFPIGGKVTDKPLVIAEGITTALSIWECVGFPVWMAGDAGNLLPVAEVARHMYPDRGIILAADNDTETPGNPGVTKATAAALAVGGSLAVPRHDGKACDWNDLHRLMGSGEVQVQFMMHKKPEATAIEESGKEKLPAGFSLRTGGKLPGLWHTEVKDEGDPVETWIGAPLHVLGKTRDVDGNAWGLLLEWNDPEGRRHTWAMPKSLLVGRDTSAYLGRFVDEGWTGAPGNNARNKLAYYLATYETKHLVRCVDRTGWHNGAFVLPDTIIKSSQPIENVSDVSDVSDGTYSHKGLKASDKQNTMSDVSDGERIVLQVRTAQNPFRMAGTLEDWQTTIGEWARGNSRFMLAVCASLAASLLELSGQESGGFNFIGGSSTGKTTALVAAGSVWGKGSSSGGYVQSWRATDNGLEGIAALHSDAALCLDEIGQAPGRTIKEASYMLANGMGKARASADGSARTAKTWRIMVLSTGEKGLADKIAEEGGKVQAGQLVRLVDIPADAGSGWGIFQNLHGHDSPQAFSEAIKLSAATHYGHAARAFISAFLNSPDATTHIPLFLAKGLELICPRDATSQVQRVAKRFLLCAAAGEAAFEWGILPWGKGEALAAAKTCFEAWLSLRGGMEATEDTAILEQVMLFIEQHGSSRFQDIDNPTATCINRVGFRRKIDGGIEYMILPESFRAEVCRGLNVQRAAALLHARGLLVPGEGRNMARMSPCALPGLGGRKRCYTLLLKGEDSDAARSAT